MSDTSRISKSELINEVAECLSFTKKDVKAVVDCFVEKLAEHVTNGETVTLQGFARFFVKEAQERSFRGIHTNAPMTVGKRMLPKIRYAREIVNKVKGTEVE